jgi:hypothetical protein
MPAGRPLKFKTPEELELKANEYFADCIANDEPILITGLAYHLETTRELLCNYEDRDEFHDTIKRIKLRCAMYAEKNAYVGKNPSGAIFMLKNYGFTDKQEIEHSGNEDKPVNISVTFKKPNEA